MKKNIIMAVFGIIAMVLSVASVSAAMTVTDTFSETNPVFGDENQMASNPDADEDSNEYLKEDTGDVTLNNDGASDVTILSINVISESGFSESDLDIILNDADLTVSAGSSESITLKARIPEGLDAVNSNLEEVAFKVATVTFNFDDSSTVSFDVWMQRKNMLVIEKTYVDVDGNRDDYSDGSSIDDKAKPLDDVEVEVRVKNIYDENEDDLKIKSVDVEVKIDDSDMDIKEKDDVGRINAEDVESGTISFKVDYDIGDDTYDMEIFVDGKDEYGAKHGQKNTLKFEVERDDIDIRINSASLSTTEMSCTGGSNSINLEIFNLGQDDEDEAMIIAKNDDIGLDFKQTKVDLRNDKRFTKTISFVVGSDVKAGTYPIRIEVYDKKDGFQADLVDLNLIVKDCVTVSEEEPEGELEVTVPEDVLEEFGITETVEDNTSFINSIWFVILMVALGIGVLGGYGLLIMWLVRRQ